MLNLRTDTVNPMLFSESLPQIGHKKDLKTKAPKKLFPGALVK